MLHRLLINLGLIRAFSIPAQAITIEVALRVEQL